MLVLKVPPLKTGQPLIESIHSWNNNIIVSTEKYKPQWSRSFWRVDNTQGVLMPFYAENNNPVLAISESSLRDVIAVSSNDRVELKFLPQPTRKLKFLPQPKKNTIILRDESIHPFRLAANHDHTFLVSDDRIIVIPNKRQRKIIRLDGRIPEEWRIFPRAIAATETHLIVGYDHGEWGGAAYSFAITRNGDLDTPNLLLEKNVCAIDQDAERRVWIASGLSHLGLREAGLHVYDGKEVTAIISQRGVGDGPKEQKEEDPLLSLREETEISGMIVHPQGEVIFVATEGGILSYRVGHPPKRLWDGNLGITYGGTQCSTGSYPQGIAVNGNSLYIASRSLGVFRFERDEDERYRPQEQILFHLTHSETYKERDRLLEMQHISDQHVDISPEDMEKGKRIISQYFRAMMPGTHDHIMNIWEQEGYIGIGRLKTLFYPDQPVEINSIDTVRKGLSMILMHLMRVSVEDKEAYFLEVLQDEHPPLRELG